MVDALLAAGARDAWTTPITMKRGRPAQLLSVLAAPGHMVALRDLVFASTSTIGVRVTDVTRWALDRGWTDVDVAGHRVGIKVAHREGRIVNAAAEFRDVEAAAAALRSRCARCSTPQRRPARQRGYAGLACRKGCARRREVVR